MGKDRKHMKKARKKRIEGLGKQIDKHENMIEHEKPIKDTTRNYWKDEIEKKFAKKIEEDEEYLEKHK